MSLSVCVCVCVCVWGVNLFSLEHLKHMRQDVLRELQECLRVVCLKFQGCFKEVSRVVQGSAHLLQPCCDFYSFPNLLSTILQGNTTQTQDQYTIINKDRACSVGDSINIAEYYSVIIKSSHNSYIAIHSNSLCVVSRICLIHWCHHVLGNISS